mgnify:CR=1 FL=1
MAINFNNQNQNGIGNLDLSQFGLMQPQNQNMQVADAYNTPTEGEYGFNLIELDKLKNAGYDPAELSTYPNQEDVQSIIRNLEPTSMSISNYDQLFGPKTMSDANQSLYTGVMDRSGTPIGEDIDMGYTDNSFNTQPRQGILQGLQSKIGAGFNNVKDFAIDKGRMGKNLIGAGAAKFAGLPGMVGSGLMSLLSNLGNGVDYQQYTPGFDYNGLNDSMINDFYDPATGLNRFDRARRKGNTFASARTGAEYFKLRREKKAQDKINAAAATKAAEAAARGNYTPGGSHLSRGTSGGGLGLSQAQAQSVSQANKDAGYSSFSGLKDGGLASMFTRRR